ncbi:hypothetical protein ABE501_20770, partial [Comamonas testosteroni]
MPRKTKSKSTITLTLPDEFMALCERDGVTPELVLRGCGTYTARIITDMQVLKRNPTTWLMLLVTLLACLAMQTLGQKTASGQIYGLQSASWGSTPWEAAPRLGLRASASENVSAPLVGLRREAAQLDDNDPRKAQLNQQAQQLDSDWGSDGKLRVLAH